MQLQTPNSLKSHSKVKGNMDNFERSVVPIEN